MGERGRVPESDARRSADRAVVAAGIAVGIASILFSSLPIVGFLLGVVAIALAGEASRRGATARESSAARICGTVGAILSIAMLLLLIVTSLLGA